MYDYFMDVSLVLAPYQCKPSVVADSVLQSAGHSGYRTVALRARVRWLIGDSVPIARGRAGMGIECMANGLR